MNWNRMLAEKEKEMEGNEEKKQKEQGNLGRIEKEIFLPITITNLVCR